MEMVVGFLCPACDGNETIETGSTGGDVVRCRKCRYRCTWAEVLAYIRQKMIRAYREAQAESRNIVAVPKPIESDDSDRLARIEANQAAIIRGLNQLGSFLKMDWQEIEAAQ